MGRVGNSLASATFTNETASGWQTVAFASPVAITANTTYVASYHTSGYYSANGNFFASAYVNAPLTAPSSSASGGNGIYAYGSAVTFPTNSYNATNYWVDVLFSPTGAGGGRSGHNQLDERDGNGRDGVQLSDHGDQ